LRRARLFTTRSRETSRWRSRWASATANAISRSPEANRTRNDSGWRSFSMSLSQKMTFSAVDKRRPLHRHRCPEWIKGRLFRARSVGLMSSGSAGFAGLRGSRGSMRDSEGPRTRTAGCYGLYTFYSGRFSHRAIHTAAAFVRAPTACCPLSTSGS
jgi:hypothetical protein